MEPIQVVLLVLLLGVALAGAVCDLWKKKIFDWLTLPALGAGLLLQVIGFGLGSVFVRGLVSSILGACFCTVVFGLFFWWGRRMGGGDVKLMAAVGALAGFTGALRCSMYVALFGAALALVQVALNLKGGGAGTGFVQRVLRKKGADGTERLTVPYGLAIFLGVLWASLAGFGVLPGF